jgi:thioredoxin-like negative regulator of GroEL
MKPWIFGAALALLVVGCTQAKKPLPAAITWTKAIDATLADAQTHHRPILLDMYTDWCEWCTALDETTYVDPAFIEFSKRFTMSRINAEVDTVTAAHYHVRNYPTVLLLNEKGEEIDRVVGYLRAPEFIAQVNDYIAGRNTLASVLAQEPAHQNDPEFIYKLADRLADHGRPDDSKQRFLRFVTMDPKNVSGKVDDAYYRLARMARSAHDYASDRKYAQTILDKYPDSDMMRPAFLEVGQSYSKTHEYKEARGIFLDYAKRFPDDGDAPWAREQADTLAAKIAAGRGA